MKTFLLVLLALFLAPFILAAGVLMITALFKMIVAAFMFVIPAAFILAILYFIGAIVETYNEQTTMAGTSRDT